jgi:hypothetical protein
VVAQALDQLALMYADPDCNNSAKKLRIGHVILTGNGHAYFRQTPWTSSDILATLRFDFKPGERGLELANGWPIWAFTPDYIDRLRTAVVKARSN